VFRFAVFRVAQAVGVLVGVSVVVFLLIRLSGNPVYAMLPIGSTRAQYKAMSKYLGLNKPITSQFVIWLNGVVHGRFGNSFYTGQAPALSLVVHRIPATLLLTSLALVVAVIVGVAGGMLAAIKSGTWVDSSLAAVSGGFQSMPTFWFGIMLIIVFAVEWRLLPAGGSGSPADLVLPVIALASGLIPQVLRLTRARLNVVLHEDYIRTARAKGVSESRVLLVHALKNAGAAIITIVGTQFAYLMAGVVAVESVFVWPGIGSLLVTAVQGSDFPVIQATVFVIVLATVLVNLLTDLSVRLVDPRIRRGT
jgi:peptide/nickel transport system permease protein